MIVVLIAIVFPTQADIQPSLKKGTSFKSDDDRECKPTEYAEAQGAFTSTLSSYYGNCW